MFRIFVFKSLYVVGAAFTMRGSLPRVGVRAHASIKMKNTHAHGSIGLLSGVEDVKTSMYYSRKLDLKAVSNLLSDKDYIYKSALDDVGGDESKFDEYLSDIMSKKKEFMKRNVVWNHDKLKGTLKDIIENEVGGTFACLLGGKSTGKSLILHDMENNYKEKMFLVDLRDNPNIIIGLLDVLQTRKRSKWFKGLMKNLIAELAPRFLDATAEELGSTSDLGKSLTYLYDANKERLTLQKLIYRLLEKIPGVITIVIDEANIAFTLSDTANEQQRNETIEALKLFTKLTKQIQRINVILVSSEHAFPFRMSEDFNFNLANMNKFIYAGEVPPNDMYTLLTTQWGVKHNLAMALISHYGGHIYDVYLALDDLKDLKSSFTAMDPLSTQSVIECLKCKDVNVDANVDVNVDVDKNHMNDTLKRLAIDGFVPLTDGNDPIARIISKCNVVLEKSKPMGVPLNMWRKSKYGLVPSKQSMRLAIAEELQNRENE